MGRIRLEAARTLEARPERVWEILSDYRVGHPSILPKAFGPLRVEAGGIGAGTVISFDMRLGGPARHFHGEVSAPTWKRMRRPPPSDCVQGWASSRAGWRNGDNEESRAA